MWLSQGSKLEITNCYIESRKIDTDDPGKPNYYRDARVAFYIFDSETLFEKIYLIKRTYCSTRT